MNDYELRLAYGALTNEIMTKIMEQRKGAQKQYEEFARTSAAAVALGAMRPSDVLKDYQRMQLMENLGLIKLIEEMVKQEKELEGA